MVILTGSVVYIFTTGQRIFRDSDRQVQIFQMTRHLTDSIERELPIAAKTHNMEFFTDKSKPANGQFEPKTDEVFPGQVFFSDLRNVVGSGTGSDYIASMVIHSNEYVDPDTEEVFRCDALYYGTTTTVRGIRRNALVCYCLETTAGDKEPPIEGDSATVLKRTNDDRFFPVLKRYVIYKDPQNPSVLQYINSDLCSYVLDFRISYFFYNPSDASEEAEFIEPPITTTKEFCYRGEGEVTELDGRIRMTLSNYLNGHRGPENIADKFSQIAPGDRIFLYTEEATPEWNEEDNREYIIDAIDRSEGIIYFRSGDTPPVSTTGVPLQVNFRAGYLPGCVRLSFKICDDRRNIIRHVTRYIKLKAM
jgi:hypothetical protein